MDGERFSPFPFSPGHVFLCQAQQRVKHAGVNLESDAMEVPCLSSRLQRCGLEAMMTWPWLVEIVFWRYDSKISNVCWDADRNQDCFKALEKLNPEHAVELLTYIVWILRSLDRTWAFDFFLPFGRFALGAMSPKLCISSSWPKTVDRGWELQLLAKSFQIYPATRRQ